MRESNAADLLNILLNQRSELISKLERLDEKISKIRLRLGGSSGIPLQEESPVSETMYFKD